MNRLKLLVFTAVVATIFLSGGCSSQPQKVVDRDGNSYTTVLTGSMLWTGKNLDVAHYRNSDPIPEIKNPKEWASLTTGAWCYNLNNPDNGKAYGKLYNWYAVNDPRGLAMEGWHIATDAEWSAMSDLLGGTEQAGGALKATTLWKEQTSGVNSKSGFDALPAGARRDTDGNFMPPGQYSRLWSSTESSEKTAWCRSLGYFDAALRRGMANKKTGFSVRCVKN
jgi:uncharacterized protein (TIGR02145 family)